jgi:biotin/methionine sulfoxide reductase
MQPPNRLHSQLDPSAHSQAEKVAGRERISLNPSDAEKRGICSGHIVRVYNERGACLAGAEVSANVRAGVVLMATGAWFDPADDDLERHGNPNVLTLDIGTSRLTQGPSALSALVEVERWKDALPDLAVFKSPEFGSAS